MAGQLTGKQYQHRKTQDSKLLRKGTTDNYRQAIAYFIKKEEAFQEYAIQTQKLEEKQDLEEFKKNFATALQEELIKNWQEEVANEVLLAISEGAIEVSKEAKANFKIVDANNAHVQNMKGHLPKGYYDKLVRGSNTGKGNLWSILGFAYEDYINERNENIRQDIKKGTITGAQSLMAEFLGTGSKKSTSFMRKGKTSIRPDLGNEVLRASIEVDGALVAIGATSNGKDLGVELQHEVTWDYDKLDQRTEEQKRDQQQLLQDYLKSHMYGIQVKRWESENFHGKKYTNMAQLQSYLNNIYKGWDINFQYAAQIMGYEVSRRLAEVVGINTLGVMTGKTFMWTSQLLKDYFFSMELAAVASGDIDNFADYGEVRISNAGVYLNQASSQAMDSFLFDSYITAKASKPIKLGTKKDKNREELTVLPFTFKTSTKSKT